MRVLRKFNQLQTKPLSDSIFVTLTARHEHLSPEQFQNAFLKSFLPELKQIIPNLVYAWRLEPHRDGFPHYHFFAWSWDSDRNLNSQYYRRQIRDSWSRAICDWSAAFRRYGCKVKGVRSHRKAMSYVSKYVAKEDDLQGSQIKGRRWGTSTNFPAVPITEIKGDASHFHSIKRAVKRLLKSKGGRFEKIAASLDDRNEIFLWLSLDEIMELLRGIPELFVPIELEFYARSGKAEPDEQFFADYPGWQNSGLGGVRA